MANPALYPAWFTQTKVQSTPMLGTTGEIIRLKGEATIAWAEFDPAWYVRQYPDASMMADTSDAAAVLRFYIMSGQQLGHSPNPWFDEAWYRQQHPSLDAAIREGAVASGFDDYCRSGYDGQSPHWLYDDDVYRSFSADLTEQALQAGGFANRYDHYLRQGSREDRVAHLLFDAPYYLRQLDEQEADEARRVGVFRHFLHLITTRQQIPRTSVYFDPDWYIRRYPWVAERIGTAWQCALHHYLANPAPTSFDPLPDFSEITYLGMYPDIVAALDSGIVRNGYQHFLGNGVFELRSPCETIDLQYYTQQHDSVRSDLKAGHARDAFAHLLLIGRAQGLSTAPAQDEAVEKEAFGKAQLRLKAENLLPILARQPLDFSYTEPPAVSVVVVMHNNFALSMLTLSSLRANYDGGINLILIDSGSTDQTRSIGRFVRGAELLRFDDNIGFVQGCNAALVAIIAPAVLYLNNDVELLPGAVAAALRRLASDTQIGAVGAKIIRMHGKLQEAGSIIWRDGVTLGYLRDASPLAPEANFVRDVDFCSAAFLLVRSEVVRQLQGFATVFAPAYYEDADLCARIIQAGLRVVYDPSVAIYHYEYGTAVSLLAVKQQTARARQAFAQRNRGFLRDRYDADPMAQIFARCSDKGQRRILFIEDQVPLRTLGSGFVRSNDLVRTMAALGFHVTVFPIYASRSDVISIYSGMPDTVEVMYDRSLENLPGFLTSRDGYYDTVWIVRTHNLDRIRTLLDQYVLRKEHAPRIILDTEAINALRVDGQSKLNADSDGFDLGVAIKHELSNAAMCQDIIAVNEREAAVLRDLEFKNVSVIGHARDLDPTERPFAERSGMLFIGALHTIDSPNYDSLCWFVDEVLPLVERELGWETRLTIAGYVAEGVTLDRFHNHARITVRGPVEETRVLYNRHRVFVAPTRFAAGAPYKVFEAASFGLPVVASELLRQQLDVNEPVILSADVSDPARFAQHIVRLHRDPILWQSVRRAAIEWLRNESSMTDYQRTVSELLGPARID